MNIITKTYSGKYIVRPDTTWERDNEDFYPPEFVSALSYTPVIFARISKPGRSIGRQFASRYYDGLNFGILLYPEDLLGNGEEDFACASCLDHTSFLPFPVIEKGSFNWNTPLSIIKNGSEVYFGGQTGAEMIEKAIEEATRFIYIRSGDILALELRGREMLCESKDGTVSVSIVPGDSAIGNFNIIF